MEMSSTICLKRISSLRWWTIILLTSSKKKKTKKLMLGRHHILTAFPLRFSSIGVTSVLQWSIIWYQGLVQRSSNTRLDWYYFDFILKKEGIQFVYKGINLLQVVGKFFAKLLFYRLTKWKCSTCCILVFDPAKNAIPRWCTGRKWHILMAVMKGNRVGGNWLMKWDEVKKFPWYTHRLMHRKRVTCELHDSHFRLMTIKNAISKIE